MQNPLAIWIAVLTRPNQQAYEEIYNSEYARGRTALLWLISTSFVSVLISLLGKALLPYHPLNQVAVARGTGSLSPEQTQQMVENLQWMMSPWLWFFLGPFIFLLFVSISHFTAIILGGDGKLGPYSYLIAAIQVPIGLLISLLSWLPVAGQCFTSLISLGMYIYFVIATKVAYKLGTGKAILAALTPFLLFILFFMCYIMFLVMAVIQ